MNLITEYNNGLITEHPGTLNRMSPLAILAIVILRNLTVYNVYSSVNQIIGLLQCHSAWSHTSCVNKDNKIITNCELFTISPANVKLGPGGPFHWF